MEYKARDKNGNQTDHRLLSAEDWFMNYKNSVKNIPDEKTLNLPLPETPSETPGTFKQFVIFTIRNAMTRAADTPYMLLLLLSSPILAVLMSVFLKSTDLVTHKYIFLNNDNIPVYLFISVLIAIFQGLILSSGEIFRDLNILKREVFLNLSPFAYLNSKVVYLLVINAYQVASFIWIGNSILNINDLFWYYFIILWVTAMTSSLIGLNISARFKSILSIYITIPFILIPKILLAGAILDFEKIHHTLSSEKYVPVYADFAISRWAYEGLANVQFSLNKYDYHLYDDLIDKSNIQYHLYFIMPLIKAEASSKSGIKNNTDNLIGTQDILKDVLDQFPALKKDIKIENIDFNDTEKVMSLLKKIDKWLKLCLRQVNLDIDQFRASQNIDKKTHYNQQLAEFTMKQNELTNYIRSEREIIRKYQPCYYIPDNKFGRAHYYAPYKRIGNLMIKTWIFNTLILLVFGIVLYLFILHRLYKNKL